MKKSLLLIATAAVLFSCKKKEDNNFEATDMTGTTTVQGLVTRSIGGNSTPMAGATVLVKVKNNGTGGLYPNSSAVGSEVYSATTNAAGRYSVSVKTNGTGVNADVTFNGFSMANDTAMSAIVYDYPTFTTTVMLYKGLTATQNYNYNGTALVTPANQGVGTATVSGMVTKPTWVHTAATGPAILTNTVIVPNRMVYLEYDKDPMTLSKKVYTTTTDANGRYSFVVTTPNSSSLSGFNYQARIYTTDFTATNDTVKFGGGVNTGKPGVFPGGTTTANNVYSTIIKNGQNVIYGSFMND